MAREDGVAVGLIGAGTGRGIAVTDVASVVANQPAEVACWGCTLQAHVAVGHLARAAIDAHQAAHVAASAVGEAGVGEAVEKAARVVAHQTAHLVARHLGRGE